MSEKTIIFVLGGPGSGKGTQSAKLVEEFQFQHISAGDLLREEMNEPGSQYGETISNCIKDGLLVPLEITISLLKQKLDQSNNKLFLIDGFPRELDQALEFEKLIALPNHVLFFTCSEEVMLERLLERGKTSGRTDDNEESIQKRFITFKNTSLPVIDYYKEQSKVTEIPCDQSPDEVHQITRQVVLGLGIEPALKSNPINDENQVANEVANEDEVIVTDTSGQAKQPEVSDDAEVSSKASCCCIL